MAVKRFEPKTFTFCISPVLLDLIHIGEQNIFVGPLSRVRPRNGILGLVLVLLVLLPLRSEFIGGL